MKIVWFSVRSLIHATICFGVKSENELDSISESSSGNISGASALTRQRSSIAKEIW